MQNIYPCLWFDTHAEEAARFYTSIFKNSKIETTSYYSEGMHMPEGTALVVTFQLNGQNFMALNGGKEDFGFSPAMSLYAECDDQAEVDRLWEQLSAGGEKGQCGWLTDKYGVSWQVVPKVLGEMMNDADPARSARVMQAVLKMTKLDIKTLEQAYQQGVTE